MATKNGEIYTLEVYRNKSYRKVHSASRISRLFRRLPSMYDRCRIRNGAGETVHQFPARAERPAY